MQLGDLDRDLAAAALGAGRRRRLRQRAAQAAPLPSWWRPGGGGAAAHPQLVPPADRRPLRGLPGRINKPWRTGDLIERGRSACRGRFGAVDAQSTSGTWYAVAQDGGSRASRSEPTPRRHCPRAVRRWPAPGYVDRDSERYVIRDVVSGQLVRFPTVEGQRMPALPDEPHGAAHRADIQSPGYFSPMGGWPSVQWAGAVGAPLLLVLGVDGPCARSPLAEGVNVAGWLDDTQVLAPRSKESGSGDDPTVELTPVALGLTGQSRARSTSATSECRVLLQPVEPLPSPDRRTLVLGVGAQRGMADNTDGSVTLGFDSRTGRQVEDTYNPGSAPPAMSSLTEMGSLYAEWRGQDQVAPLPGEAVTVMAMRREPQQAVLVADPRLHSGGSTSQTLRFRAGARERLGHVDLGDLVAHRELRPSAPRCCWCWPGGCTAGGSGRARGLAETVAPDPGMHRDGRGGAGVDRAGRPELLDVQDGGAGLAHRVDSPGPSCPKTRTHSARRS